LRWPILQIKSTNSGGAQFRYILKTRHTFFFFTFLSLYLSLYLSFSFTRKPSFFFLSAVSLCRCHSFVSLPPSTTSFSHPPLLLDLPPSLALHHRHFQHFPFNNFMLALYLTQNFVNCFSDFII
jgi:hypothetical protein